MEWTYVMTLVRRVLPELSYDADEAATLYASSLKGQDIYVLKDLDWSAPVVYMPPFEKVVDGTVVIAVEGYTVKKLIARGVKPDVVVTDFDFYPEHVLEARLRVVHVHGDNYYKIPKIEAVYTVQTWPLGCTFNVSGFTDGDRALYLAYYLGAKEVAVSGFYPHVVVKRDDVIKKKKLAVAQHLVKRLGSRLPIRFY
ncbi:MAG: 6-hydroxymethylpterin diphosphokinase MptE-like protein [Pyrobaculum sp.]